MKSLVLVIGSCTAISLAALAQEASQAEPPELVNLRLQQQRAMQRAAVPVLSEYVKRLEVQKNSYTQQSKLEWALAVDKELKAATNQLKMANAAAAGFSTDKQLVLISADYGSIEKKRGVDILKNLRKAQEAGAETIILNTGDAASGIDPAPFVAKQTTIVYTIGGEKKQRVFKEGHKLNFAVDLH